MRAADILLLFSSGDHLMHEEEDFSRHRCREFLEIEFYRTICNLAVIADEVAQVSRFFLRDVLNVLIHEVLLNSC